MTLKEQFKDCYGSLESGVLKIGNDCMERSWSMTDRLPVVLSVKDKSNGKEWVTAEDNFEWLEWENRPRTNYAFYHQELTRGAMTLLGAEAAEDDDLGIGEKHLRVTLHLGFDGVLIDWVHLIYPGIPVMRSYLQVRKTGNISAEQPLHFQWPAEHTDCLPVAAHHSRWEGVCFYDKTDDTEDLVQVQKGLLTMRESKTLQGNLLGVRDCTDRKGLLLVKEGPTPLGYLPGMDSDFQVRGFTLFPSCWGFGAKELEDTDFLTAYGSALILWDGTDYTSALHRYHRALHRFNPELDAQIMANTWGDGNADGRIGESFLLDELKSAAELGVNFFQIDDGWEQGTTCNSVNAEKAGFIPGVGLGEGYYKSDPEFWSVNKERLPNGLEPLVDFADAHGIKLGLWFSPDSENNFESWERDSDRLLELYKTYGVRAFKMDGLRFAGKLSEENFVRLMRRVVEGTNGKVFFNLDTTAGVRNGYFGRVQYGSLFLENRFTRVFGHRPNYWPHGALRHLWQLSRYLPTERLQIQFLNPGNHTDNYGDDPLSPKACGMEYIFAVSMFASPLAWMELSNLGAEDAATLKQMISVYRPVQEGILSGHVQPIGDEPDGFSWTGFRSVGETGGYLLLIREHNDESSHEYTFPDWSGKTVRLEKLLGSGTQEELVIDANGRSFAEIPEPMSFALYRYEAQ